MQHERGRHLSVQGRLDRVEVFGALGQHQHLAALLEGSRDLGGDGLRSVAWSLARCRNTSCIPHSGGRSMREKRDRGTTSRSCGAPAGLAAV